MKTATEKAVAYAKERGKIISFDPNLRKPLWRSLEDARQAMLWGLSQADIVKISDEEVLFLWHCEPQEALAILHEQYGVKLAFVTLGPNGCLYSGNGYTGQARCPKVHPVDTTGAGDIFGGSVLARLLQLNKPLSAMDDADLRQATRFACCAASLSTERFGGISSVVPLADVLRCLADESV